MKKVIMLFALAILAFQGKAQVNYGIQGGLSLTKAINVVTDPTSKTESRYTSDMDPGLILGMMAEVPLGKSFTLRPELNFLQKNYSLSFYVIDYSTTMDVKIRQNYLDLPVNVLYHFPVGTGKMYFGAGPRLSLGLHGIAKNGGSIDIHYDGNTNVNATDNLHLRAFDLGAGLIAGQQFANGIYGSLDFTFGISNIDPDSDVSTLRQNIINLKVGYVIPQKHVSKKK